MARRAPPTTRMEVLHAAEACFAEHGLEATKVEDITARAKIAKGAFYTYFESKDDCWKQIVEAFLVRLAAACELPMHGMKVPLQERAKMWLAHEVELFGFCWDNRSLLGMLLNGAGGSPYAYLLNEFAARSAKVAETVIRAHIEEGVYRADIDVSVVGSLLGGAYDRLVRELLKETKRPDVEARCRQAQRLFMVGLLTDEARNGLDATVVEAQSSAIKISRKKAGRAARGTARPRRIS